MAEATFKQEGANVDYTPVVAGTAGEVRQDADGRAGVPANDLVAARLGALRKKGIFTLLKTANIAILNGGKVYWDHSANTATFEQVNDQDFYVGVCTMEALAADAVVMVQLNERPDYIVETGKGSWTRIPSTEESSFRV